MSDDVHKTSPSGSLLTHAECELILLKAVTTNTGSLLKLKGFEVINATEAVGFLGEYKRLVLNYAVVDKQDNSNDHQLVLFIKSLPLENNEPAKEAIFKKETRLYNSLLKELQALTTKMWKPKTFYTRNDLFVMEDLEKLGYTVRKNPRESLSDVEIKNVLNTLAILHATSIAYEAKNDISIGEVYKDILQEITISPDIAWYTTGLKAVMAVVQKYSKEKYIPDISNKLAAIYGMIDVSEKYQNVICHRDAWLGNIFFHNSALETNDVNNSAVLVDFQTCRYCAASIDVVFVLYMNLQKKERQLKESTYLEWYYHKFWEQLESYNLVVGKYMTWQDLLRSYHEFRLMGSVYKAIAMTILQVPKNFVTNEYKHVERTQPVLDYMAENVNFRTSMLETVAEIVELLLIDEKQQQ
ncbi:uncharacterized protein LOC119662013 [Teleopsis dalmanni]|uniref:uncharacterized protein LOC119662013 n=1 Tax=Teleopsis dalmanni TaxID=139649 RepID=UPI0018CDA380|nr:uncharacterized protein LOC119662013 [Teleopsis dalmanni]